jgi:undecaprenyl diphosphate synthase
MNKNISFKNLPKHLAIIMDGNGRWAQNRNLERIEGHIHGIKALRTILRSSMDFGIKYLTVFAFSTENWQRSKEEVSFLMDLLEKYIALELPNLIENGINLNIIGNTAQLPPPVQQTLLDAINQTSNFNNLFLTLALSYGSREEILNAAACIAVDFKKGLIKNEKSINEKLFSSYLYSKDIPDPDLLIRTGGEKRISNFMLYQIAYTEVYFTKTPWPDFRRKHLIAALKNYEKMVRRFGKTEI